MPNEVLAVFVQAKVTKQITRQKIDQHTAMKNQLCLRSICRLATKKPWICELFLSNTRLFLTKTTIHCVLKIPLPLRLWVNICYFSNIQYRATTNTRTFVTRPKHAEKTWPPSVYWRLAKKHPPAFDCRFYKTPPCCFWCDWFVPRCCVCVAMLLLLGLQ